jgi:hypothetical protein
MARDPFDIVRLFDELPDDAIIGPKPTAIILNTTDRSLRRDPDPRMPWRHISERNRGFRVGDIRAKIRDSIVEPNNAVALVNPSTQTEIGSLRDSQPPAAPTVVQTHPDPPRQSPNSVRRRIAPRRKTAASRIANRDDAVARSEPTPRPSK